MEIETHSELAVHSGTKTKRNANRIELCQEYFFQLGYSEHFVLPENGEEGAQGLALKHRSGVELYIVACQSEESAFSYCFATPPDNDKGLAHIVEHTVFCGSKNYPLKEPFANLQKTSVCSFLNAMTYPDQTLYPAASAFAPDFLQLLKVYGDAVFFPLFERQALAQEAVRQTGNGLDGIVFNEMQGYYGDFEAFVADASLRSVFPKNQGPNSYSHANAFDAGGDPHAIATIDCCDYAEIIAFHQKYYHPQNCCIVMYGSIVEQKLEAILHYLDRELFAQFPPSNTDSKERSTALACEKPNRDQLCHSLKLPEAYRPCKKVLHQLVAVKCQTAEEAQGELQRSIMFSWLLPQQHCIKENIGYRILLELLLGHSGSVLELPIMQSDWGADISMGSGLELDLLQPVLRVGLSAYRGRDPQDFRRLIFQALQSFCAQVEAEQVNPETGSELEQFWHGALNRLEYEECSLGEHGGDDGIYAVERCLQMARASHFYRMENGHAACAPREALREAARTTFEELGHRVLALQALPYIAQIRAEGLAQFAKKIRIWTIDNPHWVLQVFEEAFASPELEAEKLNIRVAPDLQLSAEQLEQDRAAFAKYQQRRDQAQDLAKIQAMQRSEFGNVAALPECQTQFLELEPAAASHIKWKSAELVSRCKSNPESLVELDLLWEISDWSEEQLLFLPNFLELLEEMGLPNMHYANVAKQKSLYIGNWHSAIVQQTVFCAQPSNKKVQGQSLRKQVHFQLSFLSCEWRRGLRLFWELFCHGDWDDYPRLQELLQSLYYDKAQALCSNPQDYVARRAAFRLGQLSQSKDEQQGRSGTPALLHSSSIQLADLSEWLYGLGQVELLAQINQKLRKQKEQANIGELGEDTFVQISTLCKKLSAELLRSSFSCAISAAEETIAELKDELQKLYNQELCASCSSIDSVDANSADFASTELSSKVLQQWKADTLVVHRQGLEQMDYAQVESWQGSLALENLCLTLPATIWGYQGKMELHPALYLLAKLLQSGPVWEKVRLQQGAYGVCVRLNNGFFQFSSSQDPNALNSISLFRQAVVEVREKSLQAASYPPTASSREFCAVFEAAVVQTLAEKLKALPPSEHARIALFRRQVGLTSQDLEAWLDKLREITLYDLHLAASWLLQHWELHTAVIFAATKRVEEQNASFPANLQYKLAKHVLPKYQHP